jgi:hypothetical protein
VSGVEDVDLVAAKRADLRFPELTLSGLYAKP